MSNTSIGRLTRSSVAAPRTPKRQVKYSLAEFLAKEERSKDRHEFYDGIISKAPMARGSHNIIAANITAALVAAFIKDDKPYLVYGSQQLVYLPSLNFSLYPDALVVTEKPEYWDQNEVLLTNPIMVIEVLSKSTRAYDRGDKFSEYKTLDSFKEYVLIEPASCRVETRFREAPSLWRETILTNISESIEFRSVGCDIKLSDIYRHIRLEG